MIKAFIIKKTTEEKQQAEEDCLFQDRQEMNTKPVEIFALAWWAQIWDL